MARASPAVPTPKVPGPPESDPLFDIVVVDIASKPEASDSREPETPMCMSGCFQPLRRVATTTHSNDNHRPYPSPPRSSAVRWDLTRTLSARSFGCPLPISLMPSVGTSGALRQKRSTPLPA